MTDRTADDGVCDTTTNHQWRASAAALVATATAAAMAEARVMVAVKVMRTSNDCDDNTRMQRRGDADDANDDADREGWRRTDDATAQWRRGVVLPPASPDGWRGARLRPATTVPRRQDDDDGR